MARIDFKRNFKYWIIAGVLLLADGVASWMAFSRTLLPFFYDARVDDYILLATFISLQLFWTSLFFFNNRYRVDPTLSRFVEIQVLFKLTLSTTIVAVVYNELIGLPLLIPSSALLQYWIMFASLLALERLIIRQVQKFFLKRGYGRKNTLIVGVNQKAKNVAYQLKNHHLGYNVVGYVTPEHNDNDGKSFKEVKVLSSLDGLQETIKEHRISEVVIALDRPDHDRLLDIITIANGSPVSLKIIPDMYEVISGLAKTEQIHGLPLVQINPDIITTAQRFFKRVIDVLMALIVLVLLLPVWIVVAIAIKLDSKGPILYRQSRVGQDGQRFMLYKFRSMMHNAEFQTGPIWADEDDPRITKVGRFLRRFRLDEVPQFLNVLKGEMSVVGPRPERPFFVQRLMEEFPFYYRRLKIRPGITGWAQIKHSYDSTIDDVRQKLKYDFFYIENLGLSLDFKIMISTIFVMLSGEGQ